MPSCLIGHTGFIGGNLAHQYRFDDLFHSANIHEIRGREYELVVCSGIAAVKWKANRFPEQDKENIENLLSHLKTVHARNVVLISTVDVFPEPIGVTERCDPHSAPNHAYGTNRLMAEDQVRRMFPRTHVVRLPGMFGPGLKKNAIYDLIHRNALENLHPDSSFQYFDARRIWPAVEIAMANELPLAHFATEPVSTREIARRFFPTVRFAPHDEPPVRYDMRTVHASLFGGTGPYLFTSQQVEDQLEEWLKSEGVAL